MQTFEQEAFDPAVVGTGPRPARGEEGTASYSDADTERWFVESAKSRARTPFERDRARIVHSSALRRLGAKTQVLGPGSDDFVRTRLTHTLEIAQVGREIDEAALDAAITRLQGTGHLVTGFDGSRRALAALKDATSQLIGRFTGAAQDATRALYGDGPLTRYAARLVVPDETVAEILVLKGVAVAYVMAPREQEPLYQRQREVIADLVHVFSDRAPVALEPSFAADWEAAPDDAARLRVVIDQVASLTDVSAMQFHARLVRPPA